MSEATYYRTGKGSHRHADPYCANSRRAIHTGDVAALAADEAAAWEPCEACCTPAEIAAWRTAAAEAADAMCPNSGVAQPRRLNSTCRDCGKAGKVIRSTGSLRPHKPAAA